MGNFRAPMGMTYLENGVCNARQRTNQTQFANFKNINAPHINVAEKCAKWLLVRCVDTVRGHPFAGKGICVRQQWT